MDELMRETGSEAHSCKICDSGNMRVVEGFDSLPGVTSDCRPWPPGRVLLQCPQCGTVQKRTDGAWSADVKTIYDTYEIYAQSGGQEQVVFDPVSGSASARSAQLLDTLLSDVEMASGGRMMDVGCGNGSLLRQFHERYPDWDLFGTEYDPRHRDAVEAIPGVQALHCGEPWGVDGEFDVITMVHVLEHFTDPSTTLRRLKEKLRDGGKLIIAVPNVLRNPFDVTIVDHALHFSPGSLASLIASTGLATEHLSPQNVSKEISVLATKGAGAPTQTAPSPDSSVPADQIVRWLANTISAAREAAGHRHFGLFGTSIAANWLYGSVEDAVEFFVDEDSDRIGRHNLDRPILHPDQVPPGAVVFVAQPPEIASRISRRLARRDVEYVAPPPMPLSRRR